MSDRLPAKTQVYGGAGRVYPVDRTWQSDPYAAPLRFALGPDQGPVATDELIADAAVDEEDSLLRRICELDSREPHPLREGHGGTERDVRPLTRFGSVVPGSAVPEKLVATVANRPRWLTSA